MQEQDERPRVPPWVVMASYGLIGLLWFVLQEWLLAQSHLSKSQASRWALFSSLVLLAATVMAGYWQLTRIRRAERVRLEATRELTLIARHAPAGLTRVALDGGRVVWANARLARWLGSCPEELVGADFRTLVPADDPQEAMRQAKALAAGDVEFFQVQRRCLNLQTGRSIPVLCTVSLIASHEGRASLVCVLQDLSEILAARAALERSQNSLHLALEDSGSGVWEWDARAHRYVFSAGLPALLRYGGEDLARDFRLRQRLHPDDRVWVRRALRKVLSLGGPLELEARLLCDDGLYRWFKARGQRHLDAKGRLQRLSGLLSDQTASRNAEERQRLASTVVDNTIEGVVVTDARSRIISVNNAFTRLLGYTEQEMLGQTPRMFKSGRHDKAFYDAMWASMHARGHWQGEIWNRRKCGEVFPERMSLSAVKDESGQVTHYVCMFTDISEEKQREAQLEFLAHKDALTGLPNRASFLEQLDQSVAQAREQGGMLAVLLLNMNRFKDVNDSYGHAIGDQVLKHVAGELQASLNEGDFIGRMAGDELAVIARSLGGSDDAIARAERLIEAAARPWHSPDGLSVVTGGSTGICLYPAHADNAQDLLQGAHAAAHDAKSRNGRAWSFFQENMTQAARQRLAMEARLREAMEAGRLSLHFQPQIDMGSGGLVGAEVLLRWFDPVEGFISPARFIPVAESSGLIGPLGLWVLREACAQGQRWREQGLPEMTLAVNVSLHQFLLTDLAGAVAEVLADTGFPASKLELEITESMLAQRPEEAMTVMQRLRALGLRLAIDDFGTGYSSLAHLKRFPLDLLKIDQGFIRDIPRSNDDMTISSSVIALGHAMGLKVLAEGVETTDQLEFLRQKGCDFFQGYLCQRPLAASQFVRWVEQTQGLWRAESAVDEALG
ncbi:sensor domain-containing protein [Comamonas composti]|uniref:sensor domain-containing protein n=1 Tax=Comamonas composti TaxID=408558 RepID=UPI000688DA45|nr:EAL domain-containing protein [Comamonas composti]